MNENRKITLDEAKAILVVKLDRIGDFVLATSFLRELKRNASQARIDLLVSKEAYELARLCPYVDSVLMATLEHDMLDLQGEPSEAVTQVLSNFERSAYDIAVVPRWDYDYWRASIIVCASRAKRVVGFKTPAQHAAKFQTDGLFTEMIDRPFAAHEVEHNLSLIPYLGGEVRLHSLEVWTSAQDRSRAGHLLAELPESGPFVVLCPGASVARRSMSASKLIRILAEARALCDMGRILILGHHSESQAADYVAERIPACFSLCGRTTIRETAALIARSRLMIGMDSGPGHIAAALQVPTVVFSSFANGDDMAESSPVRWRPYGERVKVLQPEKAIPPCHSGCKAEVPHCIETIDEHAAARAIAGTLATQSAEESVLEPVTSRA